MRIVFLVALVAILAACGGGGGGGSAAPMMAASVPAQQPASALTSVVEPAPKPFPTIPADLINPGCVKAGNHIDCDLRVGVIGTGIPPGVFLTFTNRTADYLQVNQARAFTNERARWAEFCVHLGAFMTGQNKPGDGEVGCTSKQVGEDYAAVTWGKQTGLSVAPGAVVTVNSHTEPEAINHTFVLDVAVQTTGVHAWRFPAMDEVIDGNGQMQATAWTPRLNDTGAPLYLSGAAIYSESGASTNTLAGAACVYLLAVDGSEKYRNCDNALRTRGDVQLPTIEVLPGESVVAQGSNFCTAPCKWDWAAFLRLNP